ncbi:helix-turn-helix domain-containing protein [Streptomyces sp. NPDC007162]|uniref:helix-turn-helix domain-containing protein n=1 Tax=Streptomyces sp. NPDC007162 TaxID=3156917 RepID=UPI0033DC323D
MVASPHGEKFAARLRMLKDRSGRGYDRLGREAGASGSSLHRYCSGLSVPTDYRVVHAFAKVCGASAEELRELHRLWALADAYRDAAAATATDRDAQQPKPKPQRKADREPGADPESGVGRGSGADPASGVGRKSGVGRGSGVGGEPGVDPASGVGRKSGVGRGSGAGGEPGADPASGVGRKSGVGRGSGAGGEPGADPASGVGRKSGVDPESGVGPESGADRKPHPGADPGLMSDADLKPGLKSDPDSKPGLKSGADPDPHSVPVPVPLPAPAPAPASDNDPSAAPVPGARSVSVVGESAVAVPEGVAADDVTPARTTRGGAGRPRRLRMPEKPSSRSAILAAAATVALVAGLVWLPGLDSDGAAPATGEGLLYSPACRTVSMGQHDECVREVQTLLARAKGKLAVDGDFGPETLRRLTAFQVLAGLPATSVADDATKKALYAQQVSMTTWSAARVARRIREVFVEDPGTAVAIARCASFLDPLYVLPNTNGSRNWGVFQISDPRLRDLGGTPLRAFDPDWNIRAAHRLWSVRHDFHDWPSCQAALKATPEVTPESTPTATPKS